MGKMQTVTKYSNYGGKSTQNVDTNQEISTSKFVPKGKGGVPSGYTGNNSYPPSKKQVTLSTQKHRAKTRGPYVKAGGNKMVLMDGTKKGKAPTQTGFGITKSMGTDQFIPKKTTKVL